MRVLLPFSLGSEPRVIVEIGTSSILGLELTSRELLELTKHGI